MNLLIHLTQHCLQSIHCFIIIIVVIKKASVDMFSSDESGPVEGNCSMKSSQSWCTIESEELKMVMTYDTTCSITATPMTKQGGAGTPLTKNMLLYKSSK